MTTSRLFQNRTQQVHPTAAWYLSDLGEFRGKQELYTRDREFVGAFTVAQLEHHCPGVSRDMIRRVLREQQAEGVVECKGRGPAAIWRTKG